MDAREPEDDGPEYDDPARYSELAGFEGEWRELWWNHDFLELMAARLQLERARRVLDLGCGAGHWGRTLLPHLAADARLVGIDREAAFIEMATREATTRGLTGRCAYQLGALEALPCADQSADLVTCQTVLIHVKDPALALREMWRVLRPGGLVLAAEPDNLATTVAMLNTSLATAPEDVLALVELQQICERGKQRLGEGDASIGGRLPGLLARAGFEQISVHNSDKCARLLPPYATHDERVDLGVHVPWARERAWYTGTPADSRRHFRAGGGDEARFDALWARVETWCDAFLRDVQRGTFDAARGLVHYLVAGRKPA